MTFQVPASKASIGQDKFKFELDGKTYSIKRMKYLSLGEVEDLENPTSVTDVYDKFGEKGTPIGDAIRRLDQEQFTALMEAWQKDSEVTTGESPASGS